MELASAGLTDMEAAIPSRPASDASTSAPGAHPLDHPRRHRLDALAASGQHQPFRLDIFRHMDLAQYLKTSIYYMFYNTV